MRIGIVGTGTLAGALAQVWARAGHEVAVAGRSEEKAKVLAQAIGGQVVGLEEIGKGREAVLLAVPWDAVKDVLAAAGDGLAGTVLVDPTNPVAHGEGVVLVEAGRSNAQEIADLAPGAQVVKAFNLFPASQWPTESQVTVVMCGDEGVPTDVGGHLGPGRGWGARAPWAVEPGSSAGRGCGLRDRPGLQRFRPAQRGAARATR